MAMILNGLYDTFPLLYEPVKIPLWKIKWRLRKDSFKGSFLEEELLYNLTYDRYPERYTAKVKKLLRKYGYGV